MDKTPFELVKAELEKVSHIEIHGVPVYSMNQIEMAMGNCPIDIIRRTVTAATPMGKLQRWVLKELQRTGAWVQPAKKAMGGPYVNAANGLVTRGFATKSGETYRITPLGLSVGSGD